MSYFLLLVAFLEMILFVWALSRWRLQTNNYALLLITIMLSLQWVDALIFGLGRWIGQGDLLELLSRLRTTWFFFTSPFLLIVPLLVLRNANFTWLQSNLLLIGVLIVSAVYMVIDGLMAWNSDYYPACRADTLRYVRRVIPEEVCPGQEWVEVAATFSPMLLASTAAVLLSGVVLWIWRSWPWLGAASIAFFFGFVLMPASIVGPFLSFPLDGMMSAAIVFTTLRFPPPARNA